MGFSNASIKTKIITMATGLSLGLGLTSYLILRNVTSNSETTQLHSFEGIASSLAHEVGALYYERYGDVQAFAANAVIRGKDQSAITSALNDYVKLYGIYDLIVVTDSQGHYVASNNLDPKGNAITVQKLRDQNFSGTPWFKAVMAGQFTEDKTDGLLGTYVEDIQMDALVSSIYGGERFGNSFSAPIKNEKGDVIGVVSNRAASRWYEDSFVGTYENLSEQGMSHAELTLVSKDGTVLFDYHPIANKGSKDIVNDSSVILKLNLKSVGNPAVAELAKGESGSLITKNTRLKIDQATGYSPVDGSKFTESMGWGVVIRVDAGEVFASLQRARNLFYITLGIALALGVLISFWVAHSLSNSVSALATRLAGGASQLAEASERISNSSISLSEASTEQSAAIQETAASIDQVSAMVRKNSENAAESQRTSGKSREAAQSGQRAVEEMIQSIQEISESNTRVMDQVSQSNRQIEDIVKVISEIGNKTKVINDIVFQTKLLSFNASVEAARAGEHGKGFAVVAEEVGNLAQMSGNAAKEISEMLDSSIQRVEGIVRDTKSRVEGLVHEGRSKVETGRVTANRCGEALTNILNCVQDVDTMVAEIATASGEQATGVSEINKAMNQLDQTTQQNATVAQSSAGASEQLLRQSRELNNMVIDLQTIIVGGDGQAAGRLSVKDNGKNSESVSLPKANSKNNVVSLRKKSSPPTMVSQKRQEPVAKAVGAEHVPDSNDPRFEDI